MNQIPNIEENTREVEEVVESLLKEAINDFDMAKASAGREVSFSYWFKEEITKAFHHQLQKAREDAQAEYKQFVLNVLDGVDTADGQCNTKAIRFALESRIIHSELDQDSK